MATRGIQRGWWSAFPAPLRIGTELVAGYMMATTLSRYLGSAFAGFEVVVFALVVVGVAHALGKLSLIDEYPTLRALFDWYASSSGRADGKPTPASFSDPEVNGTSRPRASVVKAPDTAAFEGVASVKKRLEELARSPLVTGKIPSPGAMILLIGPKGTGKSDIAHEWAASLSKAGLRKSKEIHIISRAEIPGLPVVSDNALAIIRAKAEAARDGVLLIDDLDCLIPPPPSDVHAALAGEVLAGVAERNPKRLLIVASGSKEALAHLDPHYRWLVKFQEEVVDAPDLSEDALFAIFARFLTEGGKRLEDGMDVTFNRKLREIEGANFANALTIRKLAGRLITQAHARGQQVITKAELRNIALT